MDTKITNFLNLFPTDKSIVMFTNYRTGSSALCDFLAKKLNLINLDEYFHRDNTENNFEEFKNKKFIVKVMPDQIPEQYIDYLLKETFSFGLYRESIVEQSTSFYISHIIQTWHCQKNKLIDNYVIEIDKNEIENQCRYIRNMTEIYNRNKPWYNVEIEYSAIKHLLNESDYRIFTKPSNHLELIQEITTFINSEHYEQY